MKSLYKRALEIRRQSQPIEDESGITDAERLEIDDEIDTFLGSTRLDLLEETTTFVAKRRGGLFPLLVNAAVIVILAASIPLLFLLFDAQEDTLVRSIQAPSGAEGQLLATLRREAERRLAEKDSEIADAVARVRAMETERDRLRAEMVASIRDREADLEAELQSRLAQEAKRLVGRADEEETRRRLADLESRLRERFDRQLTNFAEKEESRVEQQVAGLERELGAQARDLELARAEVSRLSEAQSRPVAPPAAAFSGKERLALQQVRSLYGRIQTFTEAADYEQAMTEVRRLEALLASDLLASSAVARDVADLERFTASTLRSILDQARPRAVPSQDSTEAERVLATVATLTDQADRRLRSGDVASAENLYVSALSEIPAAYRSLDQIRALDRRKAMAERSALSERIAILQSSLSEQTAAFEEAREAVVSLEAAQAGVRQRGETIAGRLSATRREYEATRTSGDRAPSMISLLGAKAELKQAIDSPTVRAEYPDLYRALEDYLEKVGRVKERDGERAALRRVLGVLGALLADQPTSGDTDPFAAILDGLEALVGLY